MAYEGQVRTGTKVAHGRGTCTWKGARAGQTYKGEWKDGKASGQGVQTWPGGSLYEGGFEDDKQSGYGAFAWPDGRRYEGEWRGGAQSGRGVMWLPDGRVFDGEFAGGYPLRGTAMEPGGALFIAAFDGKTVLSAANWQAAVRAPGGRVAAGGGPPRAGGGGGPWPARVALPGGAVLQGTFCGLRPHGEMTLEEGGVVYLVEYDGSRTVSEGPVPVRKVCVYYA
jgi:hypothetical protein